MGIHFLLGQRFKQLVSEKHVEVPDTQTFLEALHVSQFWANIRVFFGLMGRLCSILMWRSSCNIVHRFVDHYISVALQEVPPTQHPTLNKESRSTITQNQRSLIVGLAMNTGDRTEMRWQVIQNLILMQDTTSTLVSNTLFLLSRNPASWASLRTEVLELKFDTLSAPVLTELTFLRNIFKECKKPEICSTNDVQVLSYRCSSPPISDPWTIGSHSVENYDVTRRRRSGWLGSDLRSPRIHHDEQFLRFTPPNRRLWQRRGVIQS